MNIKLKKYIPIIIEMFKFGIIGGINAMIDFSVYLSLTRNFEFWKKYYLIANILAFIVANIFSFLANKKITFKDSESSSIKQYTKFLSITIISLLITELCLFIFVNYLHISDIYGKILGIILGAIWNFTFYKIAVFKKN